MADEVDGLRLLILKLRVLGLLSEDADKIVATIEFAKEPFDEGFSRYAYKGRITKGTYGSFKKGTEVVVKLMKAGHFNEGHRLSKYDIDAQNKARELSEQFNRQNLVNKRIMFARAELHTMHGHKFDTNQRRIAVDGETFIIEPFLEGDYTKFNSNSGWSSDETTLPSFFSHWTYCHTNGRYLVCDLQGIHTGSEYLCTDPAVLSVDKEFGMTDLGKKGIEDWLACHTCNKLCKAHGLKKTLILSRKVTSKIGTTYTA